MVDGKAIFVHIKSDGTIIAYDKGKNYPATEILKEET